MQTIALDTVRIRPDQRELHPAKISRIAMKLKRRGYTEAYPIILDNENILIDGGHRLAAAKEVGLTEIPFLRKPPQLSNTSYAIICNQDGADTEPYDVFDYALLCWQKAQEGWTGQQIADELGNNWSPPKVTYYSNIRRKLCKRAWELARQFTTINNIVNEQSDPIVNKEFTIVNWTESHFRALLEHLPYEDNDKATMRAQVKAVRAAIVYANSKDKRTNHSRKTVTAKWMGAVAAQYAWQVKLAKYMRDNLVAHVPVRDRVDLLWAIRKNAYGTREAIADFEKLQRAVARLNEQALGIVLHHGDALRHIPLLDNGSIALVIADPPYNVTNHPWDKIGTDEEYLAFLASWLNALRPKLCVDYHLFLFCDPEYHARIEQLLTDEGWPLKSRVIWWNRSLPPGRQVTERFISTWQMIFHCGTHPLNWAPQWTDERFDVQVHAAPHKGMHDGGWHPTPKPEPLIKHLVQLGSKPTDIVLDPFAGGGVTGAACAIIRQRHCILIEKDVDFCKAIEKRLSIQKEDDD